MLAAVQSRREALPDFDLHRVEEGLAVSHIVWGCRPMTQAEIEKAVQEYRDWLRAHKEAGMPKDFDVPSIAVDRVWHTHMCETQQYTDDCMSYFGEILHHSTATCTKRR